MRIIASRTILRIERVAEPAAVREDQIGLQLGEPVVGDAGLGEQAEAGIDAVDGAPARRGSAPMLAADASIAAQAVAVPARRGAPSQIARSSARVTDAGAGA